MAWNNQKLEESIFFSDSKKPGAMWQKIKSEWPARVLTPGSKTRWIRWRVVALFFLAEMLLKISSAFENRTSNCRGPRTRVKGLKIRGPSWHGSFIVMHLLRKSLNNPRTLFGIANEPAKPYKTNYNQCLDADNVYQSINF